MSVIDCDDRESRLRTLIKPITWASSVSFFCGIFGMVYAYFGYLDDQTLAYGLSAVLIINFVLLFWGIHRLRNVARGRY